MPLVTSNPFLNPNDKEMIVTSIPETLGTGSDSMQGVLTKFSACWNYGNSSGELLEGAAAEHKAPSPGAVAISNMPSSTTLQSSI